MRFSPSHFLLLALGVFVAHGLTSLLHVPGNRVIIFSAESGVVLAALLIAARRQWLAILAISSATFWIQVALIERGGIVLPIVFALVLSLEGLVAASVIALVTPLPLRKLGVSELTLFTLIGAVGATLLGAVIDSIAVTVMFGAPLGRAIVSLWLAKIAGVLTVGPIVLWWALGPRRTVKLRASDRGSWPELVLLSMVAAASIWFTVGPPAGPAESLLDFPYPLLMVLIWAMIRFDMGVVSVMVAAVVLTSTATSSVGDGPFVVVTQTPRTQILSLQVYLLATVAASYFLMTIIEERKLNFLNLARSAGMHRALTENAVDMTLVIDTDGVARYLSPSILRVMGYALEDMPGSAAWAVIHPEDTEIMERARTQASAQPSVPIPIRDVRVRAADGAYRYVEGTLTNLIDEPGVEGLVINCRDITSRKAAESRIVESEKRFRMIAEAMPIPIFVSVLETGRFLYANHHALETLGASGNIIGRVASEFFEDLDQRIEMVNQVKEAGHITDFEVTLQRENGTMVTGSVSGQTFEYQGHEALISAFFDITDRKAAEEALRDSEDRFRALAEGSFQGIVVSVEGRLVEANNGFAEMMGYDSPEEMVGLTPTDLISPDTVEKAYVFIRDGSTDPVELVGMRKDGSDFPIEVRARGTVYRNNPARITAFHDLSERVLFATQKKKLEDQLRQSQKMESIGTLAGGIAHDFNNILLPIIGYAELTRDEVTASPQAGEYLDEILGAAKRARDLVGQILQFSHQQGPRLQPMEIDATISEALKLLRATTPSTIEIATDLGDQPLTVMGDPSQIHQIVLNLGTNAIHAIADESGEIRVALVRVDLDGEFAEWLGLAPGPYARMTFSDTGRGMPEEIIDRIFDPFFTTKGVGHGTGLGLSAVHGIVMAHGGGMRVQSEPGRGAEFEIYFPLGAAEAHRRNSPLPAQRLPTGTERLLFVDDEPQVAELAEKILSGLGYEVVTTTDSLRAVEMFTEDPERFDLVFTDQTMPRLSGLDLIARVREISPQMPVILATGFSESVTEERLKERQVHYLLMKPYRREEMAVTVRQALDRAGGEV